MMRKARRGLDWQLQKGIGQLEIDIKWVEDKQFT
jgi:hypothetical protein